MLLKDDDAEQPIPLQWRPALAAIAEDLRLRTLSSRSVDGCSYEVDAGDVDRMYGNIDEYGETLAPLSDKTWDTSVCQWMGDRCSAIVDLFTEGEGASDLALFVDVFEDGPNYRFVVDSVHVP